MLVCLESLEFETTTIDIHVGIDICKYMIEHVNLTVKNRFYRAQL